MGAALLIAQAASLVLVLLLVSTPADVPRVPLIQLIGDLAAATFLLVPLMRGRWVRPAAAAIRSMALRSRMITLSRVLRTVVVSLEFAGGRIAQLVQNRLCKGETHYFART